METVKADNNLDLTDESIASSQEVSDEILTNIDLAIITELIKYMPVITEDQLKSVFKTLITDPTYKDYSRYIIERGVVLSKERDVVLQRELRKCFTQKEIATIKQRFMRLKQKYAPFFWTVPKVLGYKYSRNSINYAGLISTKEYKLILWHRNNLTESELQQLKDQAKKAGRFLSIENIKFFTCLFKHLNPAELKVLTPVLKQYSHILTDKALVSQMCYTLVKELELKFKTEMLSPLLKNFQSISSVFNHIIENQVFENPEFSLENKQLSQQHLLTAALLKRLSSGKKASLMNRVLDLVILFRLLTVLQEMLEETKNLTTPDDSEVPVNVTLTQNDSIPSSLN